MSPGEAWVDALIMRDPAAARSLLEAYWLLLGREPEPWWHASRGADAAWRDCVRAAMRAIAAQIGVEASALWLAAEHMPRVRSAALELAGGLYGAA